MHATTIYRGELPWQAGGVSGPVFVGPLIEFHLRSGAQVEVLHNACVAVRYPIEPDAGGNAVVDLSHRPKQELVGSLTGERLMAVLGSDVPVRSIRSHQGADVYRLTRNRAVVFGGLPAIDGALRATGGWASLALVGPDRERILQKITAVDVRERTLPVGECCQGPIFGVNTLFGRFADRFELHVPSDAGEFFLGVVLDAGAEFGLMPAGSSFLPPSS